MITTQEVAKRLLPRLPKINGWMVEYYDLFIDLRRGKTEELASRIKQLASSRPGEYYLDELANLYFYLDTVADEPSVISYSNYAELIEKIKERQGDSRKTAMLMLKHDVVLAAAYDNQEALVSLERRIEKAREHVRSNNLDYNAHGYFDYLTLQVRFENARVRSDLSELGDVLKKYNEQPVDQRTPQLNVANAYNRIKVYRELLKHEAVQRKYIQTAIRAVLAANREVSLLHDPGMWRAIQRISSDIYQISADMGRNTKENEYFAKRAHELSILN